MPKLQQSNVHQRGPPRLSNGQGEIIQMWAKWWTTWWNLQNRISLTARLIKLIPETAWIYTWLLSSSNTRADSYRQQVVNGSSDELVPVYEKKWSKFPNLNNLKFRTLNKSHLTSCITWNRLVVWWSIMKYSNLTLTLTLTLRTAQFQDRRNLQSRKPKWSDFQTSI